MYPKEYLDFLVYFHVERDYFECHEILEEYWKEQEDRPQIWVGLIQIAVGLYHHRRNNLQGARKMLTSALKILTQEQMSLEHLGINSDELFLLLEKRIDEIQHSLPYRSMNLPLQEDLLKECYHICRTNNQSWGLPSDLTNEYLVHKHTLRDRADVITERKKQLEKKRKS